MCQDLDVLFFFVFVFTLVVETSKKSMAHCGETARSAMILSENLPYIPAKNDAASLGVSRPFKVK